MKLIKHSSISNTVCIPKQATSYSANPSVPYIPTSTLLLINLIYNRNLPVSHLAIAIQCWWRENARLCLWLQIALPWFTCWSIIMPITAFCMYVALVHRWDGIWNFYVIHRSAYELATCCGRRSGFVVVLVMFLILFHSNLCFSRTSIIMFSSLITQIRLKVDAHMRIPLKVVGFRFSLVGQIKSRLEKATPFGTAFLGGVWKVIS